MHRELHANAEHAWQPGLQLKQRSHASIVAPASPSLSAHHAFTMRTSSQIILPEASGFWYVSTRGAAKSAPAASAGTTFTVPPEQQIATDAFALVLNAAPSAVDAHGDKAVRFLAASSKETAETFLVRVKTKDERASLLAVLAPEKTL